MKIFEIVQRHYVILDVSSSYQLTEKFALRKIILIYLLFGWIIVSHFVYIFNDASGFIEYMESICATAGCLIIFICFETIIFRKTRVFESIQNIEKLIDTREPFLNYFEPCKCDSILKVNQLMYFRV